MQQFITILTKAAFDKRIPVSAKMVLQALQYHTGVHGYCWPSYERIAEEIGLSRKTVITMMKKLEFYGYVIKEKGTKTGTNKQSSNRYYLNMNPTAGGAEYVQEHIDNK